MRDLDECRPYVMHMRLEHRHIHEAVRKVLSMFSEPFGPQQEVACCSRLSERLGALRNELARHFAEEESGGCIEEALSRCPNLSSDAARLEDQHAQLLKHLDQIIQRIASKSAAKLPEDLKHEFDEFAKKLNAHEAAENRIMHRAFGTGIEDDE